MDRQAAYNLFTAFLRQRQFKAIDLQKELPKLLAYGYAKGLFQNPHLVHDLDEWCKFGDVIFQGMIDGEKMAKKCGKWWRVVYNDLLQSPTWKCWISLGECARMGRAPIGPNAAPRPHLSLKMLLLLIVMVAIMRREELQLCPGRNKNYNEWSDCPVPPAVSTVKLLPAAEPALPVAVEPSAPSPSPSTSVSDEPPASTMALQPAPSTPLCNEPLPGAQSDLSEAVTRERGGGLGCAGAGLFRRGRR